MIRCEIGRIYRFEPVTGEWRELTNPVEIAAAEAEARREAFNRRSHQAIQNTFFPNSY